MFTYFFMYSCVILLVAPHIPDDIDSCFSTDVIFFCSVKKFLQCKVVLKDVKNLTPE